MSDDVPNIVESALRLKDPVAIRIAVALMAFDSTAKIEWPARRLSWALVLGVKEQAIDVAIEEMRRHGLVKDLN